MGLYVVLHHSLSIGVHDAQVGLSPSESLIGRLPVPLRRLPVVLRNSPTSSIHHAKVVLSGGVSFLSGLAKPLHRLLVVLWNSPTFMLQTTQTEPTAIASRPDTAGPLAVATPTTRKLADASISANTRRAYAGALARLDAWRGTAPVDDARLAVYLGELFEAGRAPATAALAVAAVRFRAKLVGQADPAGPATARVLGGYRRTGSDRGRGQAAPLSADGLAAILATAERPRTDGRGVESHTTAQRRGRLDAVIAGLLFMGGLRRSEVAALRWADVTDASDGDGVLLTVRTSKTNQEGDAADVRYLKNGGAKAIRTVRADRPDAAPTDQVVGLSPLQIQRRFTAAARAAGIEARLTAHSGRVGLASELTARGASTTEVMLAGNWKTARMVAHYSAGATAERGAVARYL